MVAGTYHLFIQVQSSNSYVRRRSRCIYRSYFQSLYVRVINNLLPKPKRLDRSIFPCLRPVSEYYHKHEADGYARSIITKYATIAPCRHATLVTARVQQTTRSRLLASQAASSTFANRTWIRLRPVHTRTWSIRKSRNWSCGRNHNLRGRDLHPAHLVQMHHLTLTTSTPSWVLVRRCCLRFLLLLMVRVMAR